MKSPQPFGLRADFSDDGHKPVICPTRQVSKIGRRRRLKTVSDQTAK
jgi:hypothetical protein